MLLIVGNSIREVSLTSSHVNTIANGFNNPADLIVSGLVLYVADKGSHKIKQVDLSTGTVSDLVGGGNPNHLDGIGTGAYFNSPTGITTDGINLYVADSANHVIRKIIISTGQVSTIAGQVGTSGSSDGIGSNASFNGPEGLAIHGSVLYVSEKVGNRIRQIDLTKKEVSTLAGSGTQASTDGIGLSASFNQPRGIVYHRGNLFVNDQYTIRRIIIENAIVNTVAGIGSSGQVDGVGKNASFSRLEGITVVGNMLYTTDSLVAKVRQVALNPIEFNSSNWNAPQTLRVIGKSDEFIDGDQSYSVSLTPDYSTSDLRFRSVDPPDVSLKNLDLSGKGGYYVSAVSRDTDENGIQGFFTVSLKSAPTDNVTVYVASSDTTEGVIVSIAGDTNNTSNLTFTSSNWNSPQSVEIRGVSDNLSDGNQSYAILLSGDNTSSDLRFRYVDPPDVSLKNLDLTTKGGFYVSEASNDTDENGISSTFTVRLLAARDNDTSTADNVTITVSVSDSTEAELVSDSSLVFTESNWNAAQTVTVRGLADNLSDGDQSYTVILKDNVTSDARYRYVDPPDVSLKNLDLTTKGGFYVSEASNDTDENGISSTFTVRLSSQPGDNDTSTADNVTITVSVSDSTEAELVSDSSLVFTSNWNAAQTVTVRVSPTI